MKNETSNKICNLIMLACASVMAFLGGFITGRLIISNIEPSAVVVSPSRAMSGYNTVYEVTDFDCYISPDCSVMDVVATKRHDVPNMRPLSNFDGKTQLLTLSRSYSYDQMLSADMLSEYTWATNQSPRTDYRYAVYAFSINTETIVQNKTPYGERRFIVPMLVMNSSTPISFYYGFTTEDDLISYNNNSYNNSTWRGFSKDYLVNYDGALELVIGFPSIMTDTELAVNFVGVTIPSASEVDLLQFSASALNINRGYNFVLRGEYSQQDLIDYGEIKYDEGVSIGLETADANKGVFGILGDAFNAVASVLNIRIFGFMTLGSFLAVPIVALIVVALFKILRG